MLSIFFFLGHFLVVKEKKEKNRRTYDLNPHNCVFSFFICSNVFKFTDLRHSQERVEEEKQKMMNKTGKAAEEKKRGEVESVHQKRKKSLKFYRFD